MLGESVIKPFCIILTGAPGSGKSTIYDTYHADLTLVDIDRLGGKDRQDRKARRQQALLDLRQGTSPFVFTTGAPTKANKDYWLNMFHSWDIVLVALVPPRMVACERMLRRGHHDRLSRGIEYWYRRYQPHPLEWRIDSSDPVSAYGEGIGARLKQTRGASGREIGKCPFQQRILEETGRGGVP